MKILFIGDIVGKVGRRVVVEKLDRVIDEHSIDLVIANCENCAAGFGVTPTLADGLFSAGVEVLTSGNHIWDKKEILPYLDSKAEILRPANYPADTPGHGIFTGNTTTGIPYAIMNLQGRVHLPLIDCPFQKANQLIDQISEDILVRFIDFHAEATSEKIALGWHLDGRVSAIVGTHTHIQTADERVLPGGTAYITDVGMTGPYESVIGMNREASINRFLQATPTRFEPATGDVRLSAVVLGIDPRTGKAQSIERLSVLRD
ncbi:MAG: TIGR00282 family metallophosphoesterase [Solibacterales bacterium]|nr:TIGR00282 family metallophosphoesterase [Bryobacterales bacterium]